MNTTIAPLTAQLNAANEQIATLTSKVESEKNTARYANTTRDAATKEVEELHAIMDAIPGVMAREKEGRYGAEKNSAMVRFVSWLAAK